MSLCQMSTIIAVLISRNPACDGKYFGKSPDQLGAGKAAVILEAERSPRRSDCPRTRPQ
jgi:hypothetical protein